ncbi:MAG: hypothetical protein AVDCRST_MAG61-2059 [uncultured Friedmanniella sp.]|uniref:Tissue inhibitor of metalloproteinase n=1 Tax=uncultured Friedmanniella sp. TaxID=335381 RepID=A0A6J4KXM4_9ACTN|nr:hypothetical protein [uncultured Friedmanniella sp.]CAA9317332.1 MAG: hypothetical protein AVDCRST_MAG61-2059 [uncultured Friedmanniella sp.]
MSRARSRVAALLAVLVLTVLHAWVTPRSASACDCMSISTPRALRQADAVFRGTVTDLDAVGRRGNARIDVRFRVDAVYKGSAFREQVVATPHSPAACGLSPEVGSTWVVFARQGVEGRGEEAVARLVTTVCSGNLGSATAPAVLGEGRPPAEGSSDREERAYRTDRTLTRWLGVGAAVVAGGLVLGAVGLALLWRSGRRL